MLYDTLIAELRQAGHKITSARRAVIQALAAAAGHLTAPDLVEAVHELDPSVGRASVYRALDLLTRLGLVQATALGGAVTTYVLTPAGHHHHLVCVECRQTVEFEECGMGDLPERIAERTGFRIEGHLIEVYGRCAECQG